MAIEFRCAGCDRHFRVRDEHAGKRARCKYCGATFQIPWPEGQRPAAPATVEAPAGASRKPGATRPRQGGAGAGWGHGARQRVPKVMPAARMAGLRLTAVIAAVVLLTVFGTIVQALYELTYNEWFVRVAIIVLALGYVGYTLYLTRPRGELVTGSESDGPRKRLSESIRRVCQRAGVAVPKVTCLDREEPDAFTLGLRPKSAYICVTTGLLAKLEDEDELDAVMAHELSHIVNRDCAIATIFRFPDLLSKLVYGTFRGMLKLGWALRGLVAGLAEGMAWAGGLFGALAALALIALFFYALMYLAILAGTAFVLVLMAGLALAAYSRQQEKLADDFAVRIVGPEPVARAFLALAESVPAERSALCRAIAADPADRRPLPVAETLEAIRARKPKPGLWARLSEWQSDHPLLVRRIHRALTGGWREGIWGRLVSPLGRLLESRARWFSEQLRTRTKPIGEREAPTMFCGLVAGSVSVAALSLLPSMPFWWACLAVGLPVGVGLGTALGFILRRRGPFQGADVVDMVLTGVAAWLITGLGLISALLLPCEPALLEISWVVLSASALIASGFYVTANAPAVAGRAHPAV